ncbi:MULTISPECIES: DUF3040 domain-containing protein [unclassified Streptomyces]|uniref:DUF3040 domain-containing protein n=1 Tax=unclassified Streptomyces TaxID=2593676 RepID=UPI002E82035B|nr:DUF3040 domain-containing protein [Streptomyces sp. NBC_00566]WUB85829.1 DUF3040 domain-containing protein [Streptomyces sp. NBC_00566]
MKEVRLSPYEKRVLAEMERSLSRDPAPARRLGAARVAHPGPLARLRGRPHALPVAVTAFAVVSLTLLAVAVAYAHPVLLWIFAATWLLTLAGLIRLTLRWSRGWRSTPPVIE